MQTDKRILLILDLDETVIHASKTQLDRQADFIVYNYHIYKRPSWISLSGSALAISSWPSGHLLLMTM
nr:NIF family HAD-type phosphatase [Sporocytophaga myxococcoides]